MVAVASLQVLQAFTNYRVRTWPKDREQLIKAYSRTAGRFSTSWLSKLAGFADCSNLPCICFVVADERYAQGLASPQQPYIVMETEQQDTAPLLDMAFAETYHY